MGSKPSSAVCVFLERENALMDAATGDALRDSVDNGKVSAELGMWRRARRLGSLTADPRELLAAGLRVHGQDSEGV